MLRRVAEMLAAGLTPRDVAESFRVDERTVRAMLGDRIDLAYGRLERRFDEVISRAGDWCG